MARNINKRIKPGVAIFGALEFVALVLWMFAELFHAHQYNLRAVFLWLAMVFFLGGIVPLASNAWPRRHKTVWRMYIVIGLVLVFPVYKWTRPPPQDDKDFVVSVSTIVGIFDKNKLPIYWLAIKDTAYAVHLLMFVEFTNLKPVSRMVNSYALETLTTNEQWATMQSLRSEWGTPFWVSNARTNFVEASPIELEPQFNSAIANKNLGPGSTVKGWMLISIPREGWDAKHLRFRVQSASGEEAIQPINLPAPGLDTDLRLAPIHLVGPTTNIGKMKFRRWEDRLIP